MARRIYLLMMLFCLGIMIYPKQNFSVEVAKISCCDASAKEDHCGDKSSEKEHNCEKNNHKSGDKKCNDKCASCHTCAGFFTGFFIKDYESTISNPIFLGYKNFGYAFPNFLNQSANIWQPPKLG